MKKKLLSVLLVLVFCLGLVPVMSFAASVSYPVTGGNIAFDPATGAVTGCDDSVTAANIPEAIYGVPVTSIGDSAFRGKKQLASVTIPGTVTKIDRYAFYGCVKLTSVTIPGSVKEVGSSAFCKCSGLTSATVQNGVSVLDSGVFWECTNLQTVSLPSTLTKIDNFVFDHCSSLVNITIPSSVTEMGQQVFADCDSLISITIPGSIPEIHYRALGYCNNLKTVIIQNGVQKIDWEAFKNCTSLESIVIPDSVTFIGHNAFEGCSSLKEASFGAGLEEIEYEAFQNCTKLTTVGFSTGLKKVDFWAFKNCTSVTDVYYTSDVIAWSAIEMGTKNEAITTANFHWNSKFTPTQSSVPATPTTPTTPTTPADPSQPFTDVPANAYYADAVKWAVANGVTTGKTATTFGPNDPVTRGQAVTFLWRAVGKPTPKSKLCPFSDVKSTDYYYQPILWAVENGITNGTDATHFSPNSTLTRAHIVTFLWRTAGEPGNTGASQWYADAVTWGQANDLLSGTAVAFTPTGSCPRSDVVTYLYRADQKGAI